MDEHDGPAPDAESSPPDRIPGSAAQRATRPHLHSPEIRALRDFLRTTGGSMLFCLSAVSIFAGLSSIVGPVLGTTSALGSTLPAIGAIGFYELTIFGAMLALVLRWAIVRDTVSLLVLVAVFLVTLGLLVSTVANDSPRVVLGVGVVVVAVAVAQILLIKRHVQVPFGQLSLIGIGVLIAWNSVTSALIADYIGADVAALRLASDVWPIAAWIPVVASLLLYLDAAMIPTGAHQRTQRNFVFLRSPGMAWVFIGTLLIGTVGHLYAMRYVFDLPYYFVDYLPMLGAVSFTLVEIARGYGAMGRAGNYTAGLVPLGALLVAILNSSYDETRGLGAGLIADPSLVLAGFGLLAAVTGLRHRRGEFVFLAMSYLFAGFVLGTPASVAGEPESINWDIVGGGALALACVFLLMHRNPLLWAIALVAAVLIGPLVEPGRGWLEFETLTDGDQAALRGMMLGAGLVLISSLFARRVHFTLLISGAALLALSLLNFSGFSDPPGAVYAALTVCAVGVFAYGCTRNWIAVSLLAVPAARVAYLGVGNTGGWRFIALGFALLIVGAIWSVLGQSRAVPEPVADDSNGS